MSILHWEKNETVATITLTNGENRQNLDYANSMLKAFDEILADKDIHAVIITSNDEKNFSQGVDLGWLMKKFQEKDLQSIKDFMYRTNEVFKTCLTFPMPVIAAINGHAFGNGAILACACDFRFMRSDRGYFCFPEVDINIPFLPGMLGWCKKAIPPYKFQEMYLTGKRTSAPELEQHHVIVKACRDLDELRNESFAFAKSFTKKRKIFAEHKKRMYKDILDVMATQDPPLIESLSLMVQD
ncbi:MAG TPA: enoyl-CoA hydratase/isomerase family protein [Spirochaetota bacterium]|nr:enoyl-CoA hydratase/isomerase family protein [Spirochaetota bacterium]HSA14920.1 enoyl-CoA hydratase/isomerase family protein [Spirochaetota bacterium]